MPSSRFTLTVVAGLIAAVCVPLMSFAEGETSATPQLGLPAITVTSVTKSLLRDRVIAGGLIGAVQEVLVAPLIEGQPIEKLEADVGDMVEAGQVLARLSLTTLELQKSQLTATLASARATIAQAEAQVIEAKSSADEAQRVADRTATLRKQGAASQAQADQAQSGAISATARVTVATQSLAAARAQLSLVEAQMANVELSLTRTNVVAPVAGEVLARNAQLGAVASAQGAPMFTLMRDSALELRADVSESDITRIKVGQKALISAVGVAKPLQGTVRLVEPSVDAVTRLGRARIQLDETGGVRAGMYADAEILLSEGDVLAVPVSAVGAAPEGATVMKVVDGVVSRVDVVTGIRDSGMVEIVSGLVEGDQVVTKAGSFVRDGDHVNPVAAIIN